MDIYRVDSISQLLNTGMQAILLTVTKQNPLLLELKWFTYTISFTSSCARIFNTSQGPLVKASGVCRSLRTQIKINVNKKSYILINVLKATPEEISLWPWKC